MFNALKTELSEVLHLSKDALHIHLGLAIYLAVLLTLARGRRLWLPWVTVLAFELFNEAIDIFHHGPSTAELSGSVKDIINTMLWPTVLLVATHILLRRARQMDGTGEAVGSEDGFSRR